VDNDFFATRAQELRRDCAALRRTFDLPESGVVFLFSGRFIERKAPEAFVRAIASVSRDVPGVAGLMAGDGVLRARTEALAAELKAPIRFTGFLNQTAMVSAYAASDVLVVPSVWETWGLVVNEAMACGLPAIVTTGVACAGDLVVPRETGDVVPVGDERALTEAMRHIAVDEGYRQAVSAGARERVEQFSVATAVGGTVRAIRSLRDIGSAEPAPSVAVGAGR
jgi:glycosyltransferase involved in cell wall biosynthesis